MLLRVNVDNPGDKITEFGAGAKLYWYRDNASAAGAFTDATGSVPLVATQTQYEIVDASGGVGYFYRTRIGTAAGAPFDSYATVFQAGAPQAYATLDALRERITNPTDARDNLLSDLLLAVTERISHELGFDFFRHPAVSGTEVTLYEGRGRTRVDDPQGFASVSQVRVATVTGGTYATLAGTDWFLRYPVGPSGPWLSLRLTDVGTISDYGTGFNTVEVTGVRGYTEIPHDVEEATLEWAADLYRVSAFGGGSELGATGLGATETGPGPSFIGGMPRFTYEVVQDYKRRHTQWVVA